MFRWDWCNRRLREKTLTRDICLSAWVHYFLSPSSHFPSSPLFLYQMQDTDPPAPSWCLTTSVCVVSVLELAGNQSHSHVQRPPPLPFFSFLHVLLPLPAVKRPFWTEHKHQHNIMPYQSRHKDPWAHCPSVSASSSFRALSASAKPRKHIHDHKQDNRMKTGVATKIILGQNAFLIVAPVNYRVLWEWKKIGRRIQHIVIYYANVFHFRHN